MQNYCGNVVAPAGVATVGLPTETSRAKIQRAIAAVNTLAIVVHAASAVAVLVLLVVRRADLLRIPLCVDVWDRRAVGGDTPVCSMRGLQSAGWLLFAFVAVSLANHVAMAVRMRRAEYSLHALVDDVWTGSLWKALDRFQNPWRWIEYQVSASLMLVAVAQLSGVVSLSALIALFVLTATINAFGHLMERANAHTMIFAPHHVDWVPFLYGWVPGLGVWVAVLPPYIVNGGGAPWWVVLALLGLFVMFNSFALVMFLVYWRPHTSDDLRHRYYRGELAYQLLSLTAKTFLTWTVLGGFLGSGSGAGAT